MLTEEHLKSVSHVKLEDDSVPNTANMDDDTIRDIGIDTDNEDLYKKPPKPKRVTKRTRRKENLVKFMNTNDNPLSKIINGEFHEEERLVFKQEQHQTEEIRDNILRAKCAALFKKNDVDISKTFFSRILSSTEKLSKFFVPCKSSMYLPILNDPKEVEDLLRPIFFYDITLRVLVYPSFVKGGEYPFLVLVDLFDNPKMLASVLDMDCITNQCLQLMMERRMFAVCEREIAIQKDIKFHSFRYNHLANGFMNRWTIFCSFVKYFTFCIESNCSEDEQQTELLKWINILSSVSQKLLDENEDKNDKVFRELYKSKELCSIMKKVFSYEPFPRKITAITNAIISEIEDNNNKK